MQDMSGEFHYTADVMTTVEDEDLSSILKRSRECRLAWESALEQNGSKDASLQDWERPVFAEIWSGSELFDVAKSAGRSIARCKLANRGTQPLLCFRGTLRWAC